MRGFLGLVFFVVIYILVKSYSEIYSFSHEGFDEVSNIDTINDLRDANDVDAIDIESSHTESSKEGLADTTGTVELSSQFI